MLSSEGKQTDTAATGQQTLTTTQTKWQQGGDHEQIFQLIDSLLSFEACLYHQILPFGLEDNNLLLGIVHPQDTAALEYVGRILSYINFTMVTEPITADTHRTILSAYLNYKNTFPPGAEPEYQPIKELLSQRSAARIAENPIAPTTDYSEPNYQPTQLDLPTESSQNLWQRVDLPPIPDLDSASKTNNLLTPLNPDQENSSQEALQQNLPILPVQVPELFSPIELLATLPPKKLLEELLGRVLAGGIGRLYLERQPYEGRILWSDNGVLQSVLDKLPLSVFQGVLNELKRFTSLPVTTMAEPKQVEKECLYQQNRLLLRLRVMPGMYGEEATLQVLRGAALKFYQQQQLMHLSRDTLGITKQLSFMLHELQERLLLHSPLNSQQLEALTTLNQLVEKLDQQVKILASHSQSPENSK
ncbi:type II secretory pathway, ATPase PulE/Tfp pilus assembly pathway, ATPase PilB [Cylindrospermum stagnale PCC 7417]|uniref:Type II secretory pathway, ATPase PulE/Tfp pilus assembly pathway, ATPase PilB n=1 Tax=Cylindrospermum stagnale PCC 7417 TaxID=56107 RepID=K9WT85_9NOST|nr:type II secretory pathway, ATPase PulE/Tfp pilus assembly pathway, ATPase PilB [Cylindrospermum stagnale]AFZ22747.1 type II secretory pathway, ATPase PulE/Tfp pilus assembly pathway, ATPase PilB [Cylindrospermum stagnale PCC 7417]